MLSMTGFGAATQVFKSKRGSLEISAEIRTVNSKFLDISIRSPRPYVSFDSDISKVVRDHLKRGRVDITINARVLDGKSQEVIVNLEQAKEVWKGLEKVRKGLKISNPLELKDLLAIPDWIASSDKAVDSKEEWPLLTKVLKTALTQVTRARENEGKSLEKAIQIHLKRFRELYEKMVARGDQVVPELRQRLKQRVEELFSGENFDASRLEQEIAIWVARSDFREELDRIRHHLTTFDSVLTEKNEQGRKLEFLIQELHREVNTLGSKCSDATLTPHIIELKTCIERIREQLQNSE